MTAPVLELSRARQAAAQYIAAGWRVVPVPGRAKSPDLPDWPNRVWALSDIEPDGNVGVILGPVSGDLVDIDLDSHHAIALAPYFLPPTLTFGRKSKPRSHLLYLCPDVRSKRIILPPIPGFATECVEIRAKNASSNACGHQSVFPGSVHVSGEIIDWDVDALDEPQPIKAEELSWSVTKIAVAAAICEGHIAGSQRNNRSRAYAGSLCTAGWPAEDIRQLFSAVFEVCGVEPEQRSKDTDAVERTILSFSQGSHVTTVGSLAIAGLIGEQQARVFQRISRSPAQIATEAAVARSAVGTDVRERLIAEARALDASELTDAAEQLAALASQPVDPGDSRLGRIINLREPPQRLDFLCEGLGIAPGKISAIAGFGGVGKGPFLDAFALCTAAGKRFLGHHIRRSRVVLLDFETGPLLEWRLARLANGLEIDLGALQDEEWLTCIHARPPLDDEYLRLLETCVEKDSLVCIDSYTSAVPADQRDSSFASMAFALGSLSARRNATFLVVAHERKQQAGVKTGALELISGHAAFSAAMQTAISLRPATEGDANIIEVKCARSPIDRFDSFQIEWKDISDPMVLSTASLGEKARAADWGLAVSLVRDQSTPELTLRREKDLANVIEQQEIEVLQTLRQQYAECPVLIRTLDRAVGSAKRLARSIAVRNLVQRGAVRANYHWRDPSATALKQIWLPYSGAPMGVVQK